MIDLQSAAPGIETVRANLNRLQKLELVQGYEKECPYKGDLIKNV